MILRWWHAWRERCQARDWEVYLFNYGPVDKWREVRDQNTASGIWKRWPL